MSTDFSFKKGFMYKHGLNAKANFDSFADDCGSILAFLREYKIPLDVDSLAYVEALHLGTHPDTEAWKELAHDREWLNTLQSIKVFPAYCILKDIQKLHRQAFLQWAAQFD